MHQNYVNYELKTYVSIRINAVQRKKYVLKKITRYVASGSKLKWRNKRRGTFFPFLWFQPCSVTLSPQESFIIGECMELDTDPITPMEYWSRQRLPCLASCCCQLNRLLPLLHYSLPTPAQIPFPSQRPAYSMVPHTKLVLLFFKKKSFIYLTNNLASISITFTELY